MSKATVDFRGKVTEETHAVLEALSQATGKSYQDIAREWLQEKAQEHIHAATVLHKLLQSKGLPGIVGGSAAAARGTRGNAGEDEGAQGSPA